MEQDQEQRHVCRFCNKSFLNGKVLGGHMRCHVAKNSTKSERNLNQSNPDIEGGERVGYGLRVNPKKSCKFSGSTQEASGQEILCRVCGKGFDSLRALFGHMRHHSGKRRKLVLCKECGKEFASLRALTGHMKTHSERFRVSIESSDVPSEKLFGDNHYSGGGTSGLVRKKRSRRLRYSNKITPNSSFSTLSESSYGVECDHEVEEVAICLLMLSRGVRNWDGFSSFTESSDNNSSEVKSPNRSKRILDNDGDGCLRMKKSRLEKSELCVLDSNNSFFGDKKVSEFSENDFGSENDEEKSAKLDDRSAVALADTETEKVSDDKMKINSIETESDDYQRVEVGEDLAAGFRSLKVSLSEKTRFDYSNSGSQILYTYHKKSGYKCRTCNKIFNSHQALGGHQTVHRTPKKCSTFLNDDPQIVDHSDDFPGTEANIKSSKTEYGEISVEQEMDRGTMTSNEIKEHKCPICFKIFASGQALGGHKRAHLVKDSEIAPEQQITLLKHSVCNVCDVLDVPMTLGNEANTEVDLKSWWIKNDHKHEFLVGLIPN